VFIPSKTSDAAFHELNTFICMALLRRSCGFVVFVRNFCELEKAARM